MKDISVFLNEELNSNIPNIVEGEIKDEKAFREYAEAKLKEVFGDKYDEKKANDMVDGILKDNKELVDKDDWGALIGILNKGCAKYWKKQKNIKGYECNIAHAQLEITDDLILDLTTFSCENNRSLSQY